MRIALINENSQAAKNSQIEAALKKVVEPMGHTVDNYGMYSADDNVQLTYVQAGILAAILLNSGAADYVVTGCGTGEGAMLACNSFPGVLCGHVEDPVDAYTFAQVNDGNCVAMPFAKGCGWGYPADRVVPEQNNKKILDLVRANSMNDLIDTLKKIEAMEPVEGITNMEHLVSRAVAGERFRELFFASCKNDAIKAYVESLLK